MKHKEHIVFAAIIVLVIGGIGLQTMRSETTASQTVTPTSPTQAVAAP
jgi:uncharacterized membrane protein YjjB (DUF3815 family)